MSFIVGVYGYTFTLPFQVAGLRFEPLFQRHSLALERGRDTNTYHLTGILHLPIESLFSFATWTNTLFDLEAALTFCEQQRVALSHCAELLVGEDARAVLLSDTEHELKNVLPMALALSDSLSQRRARPTSGVCLQFDSFSPGMRTRFLDLAMNKLSDSSFQDETGLRSAFFRNTEMVKMGEAPVDVTYSLLFTGLELLARKALKPDRDKSLSFILKTFLDSLGFSLTEDEARQIAQCRNALFHRGELFATYHTEQGGIERTVKLIELPDLESLFSDTLLRVLGFTDPEINWNRWRDRMPF